LAAAAIDDLAGQKNDHRSLFFRQTGAFDRLPISNVRTGGSTLNVEPS